MKYLNVNFKTAAATCLLLLCIGTSAVAQTSNSPAEAPTGLPAKTLLAEVGMRTGITFEHALGKRWTIRYGLGEMIRANLQPYSVAPAPKCDNPYMGDCYSGDEGKRMLIFVGEYHGISPYLNVGFRWYARPSSTNSGFFAGFDMVYCHDAWKIAKDRDKDPYKLSYTFMMSPNLGYNYSVTDHLNIKAVLLPSFGIAYAAGPKSTYGILTLTGDLGITYSF